METTPPAGFLVNCCRSCVTSPALRAFKRTTCVTNCSASGTCPSFSFVIAAPCCAASVDWTAFTNFSPCGIMVTPFNESAPSSACTEAVQALDGALSLNGVTMIPQGEKFVKAVQSTEAAQQGAAITKLKDGQVPDAEQFVTHVVRLKALKAGDVTQLLQQFTKNPAGGVVSIDPNSQILVLRDYASNIRRMLELIDEVDVPVESDYKLEVIPIRYG